jgi:hypothetical protein
MPGNATSSASLASQMYENSKDAAFWYFFIDVPEICHFHLVSFPWFLSQK